MCDVPCAACAHGVLCQWQQDIGNGLMVRDVGEKGDALENKREVAGRFAALWQPVAIERKRTVTKCLVASDMTQFRISPGRDYQGIKTGFFILGCQGLCCGNAKPHAKIIGRRIIGIAPDNIECRVF